MTTPSSVFLRLLRDTIGVFTTITSRSGLRGVINRRPVSGEVKAPFTSVILLWGEGHRCHGDNDLVGVVSQVLQDLSCRELDKK